MDPAKSDPEKGGYAGDQTATTHTHELFNRARQIVRRDGRKVHVASNPAEVEPLRRKISTIVPNADEWDIVIHGDENHVEALRDAHAHQEELRNNFKQQHGSQYEEFERVIKELDRLNIELHQISDHAVNLDANFSKYGYSAHLRTLQGSGEASSSTSMLDGHGEHEHKDWEAEKTRGDYMVFYKTPVMRQYFHKGLLWRASESTEVGSYELFIDLLYVGILAITGDAASEHPTGGSLLRFAITFTMAWKIWSDVGTAISWISADDLVRRLAILLLLTALLGLTTNMAGFDEGTYQPLVGFYIFARWFTGLYFFWMSYLIPMVRSSMIVNAIACIIPGFLWIGSIFVEEPNRQALIWIALTLDIYGPFFCVTVARGGKWLGRLQPWAKRTFEFMPGNNIEHKVERTNAFISLVFGYSVIALLYQSSVAFGIDAFFGKAVLGLIQAFTFNWLYFEVDSFNLHSHAIRRHFFSALIWLSAHLPFAMAFTLAGSALSKIVIAHDLPDSHAEDLLEPYATRSEEHVPEGLVWYYCAGLGIALACTGLIALSHRTKAIPNARLRKPYRLAYRFAVSIVLLLLPLAHEHLTSLDLVAITTCLVVTVLIVELAGSSCSGLVFWGFWEKRACTYSANCKISRNELAEKAKTGETVDVEDLARRQRTGANHGDIVV